MALSLLIHDYLVGVEVVPNRRKRQLEGFGHYNITPLKYVAAELPKSDVEDNPIFTVGDNKSYEAFYNPPLQMGQRYKFYTAFVSRINNIEGDSNNGSASFPLVIPIAVVVVVLVLLVVAVLYLLNRRRKRSKQNQEEQSNHSGMVLSPSHNVAAVEHADDSNCEETNVDETPCRSTTPDIKHVKEETRPPAPSTKPKATVSPAILTQVGPIKIEMFENYVLAKRESQTNSFAVDFMTLPGDNLHPWHAAKKKENKLKNRYGNITTYDNSRVVLTPLEGDPHSDFINASFIDSVYESDRYIASQGPNTASIDDFWRMIWQHKIKKVVMLTLIFESGKAKCNQYWPDQKVVIGSVTVTPKKEEKFVDFVIRSFQLEQVSSGEVRELRQFHYINWPDMGVPQCPCLLNFMNAVDSFKPEDIGPPVIHCSAGVGRTGSYIAIDAMKEQANKDGVIDVYDFVSKMRNKRMKMVQTSAQYRFIFDTLVDYLKCGDTAIPMTTFKAEFKKLSTKDKKSRQSGLEKQFKVIEKLTVWPTEDKYKGGLDPINREKNRFQDIVPLDRSRPYLMTEVDANSTNYINAAYIDGYRTKDKFFVTQAPLPETVADIWRMAYDHKSNVIVMLNTFDPKDLTTIKYWPYAGGTAIFGPIRVCCTEEDADSVPGVTVRSFNVSNAREKENGNRIVRQFCLENWRVGKDAPSSADSLLDLIQSLKEYLQQQETQQRVTVHCIDGVGASCVFCTIMSVIDQLEYNQTIDIFQAVRRLRLVRPQAVRNLTQYTFCYKAIQAHLISSASVYDNINQQKEETEDDAQIYANVGAAYDPRDEGQMYATVSR
ncbi:receptor-type tyrosine-protein phosphatase kappa-like [Amphiura filiformis]|uniref:receptor-type tyrosine-protein phosphatase kappa-like n=1 Tax=Amphiura filiformis TaxID=82378 RepID=UPI003B213021